MSKVFVIGLDGATFDLIHPFIAQGFLPNLQSLIARGASAELTSTIPPVTASAWPSFMTGKNPGKHGLFDFMRRKKNSYDLWRRTLLGSRKNTSQKTARNWRRIPVVQCALCWAV